MDQWNPLTMAFANNSFGDVLLVSALIFPPPRVTASTMEERERERDKESHPKDLRSLVVLVVLHQ